MAVVRGLPVAGLTSRTRRPALEFPGQLADPVQPQAVQSRWRHRVDGFADAANCGTRSAIRRPHTGDVLADAATAIGPGAGSNAGSPAIV